MQIFMTFIDVNVIVLGAVCVGTLNASCLFSGILSDQGENGD